MSSLIGAMLFELLWPASEGKSLPSETNTKNTIIKSGHGRDRDGRVRLIGEEWGKNNLRGNLQWEEKR